MFDRRILIIDDERGPREALKMVLREGFEILMADNGLDGLAKARSERPDLIILDVLLPKMNGYEVCRLLKFDRAYRHIPIVMCTIRSELRHQQLGQTVGADAYVTKPFDAGRVREVIEQILEPEVQLPSTPKFSFSSFARSHREDVARAGDNEAASHRTGLAAESGR